MAEGRFLINGTQMSAASLAPGLYIVATPIGNLADITLRALHTLAAADAVAAEDTRHTGRLLQHYGIRAPLVRYDEHGAAGQRPKLLARLAGGEAVALVSDAGTPLISDPGFRLVREARDSGHAVHAIPGPSALTAALSVCGLPTYRVLFEGFLPAKAGARARQLNAIAQVQATLALYEAPHRLGDTLAAMAEVLGPREAAVARELTKRFETVERGTLPELAARFASEPAKGEIVILVAPPSAPALPDDATLDALLRSALAGQSVSAAAGEVAKATGADRRTLYKRALALKDGA